MIVLRSGLLAVALCLVTGCAVAQGVEKERAEVPQAQSLVVGNIRYEAPLWTRKRGLPQNGGYIEAFDTQTGKSLWILRVYDSVTGNSGKEQDKQDVFITELKLSADARELLVRDEREREFRVDIQSRSVTPVETTPHPQPAS